MLKLKTMQWSCLVRIQKLVLQFPRGCFHSLISQSIDYWVQNGSKDGIKHRQNLFYQKTAQWPHIDEDAGAKEHEDNNEMSCAGRKKLRCSF